MDEFEAVFPLRADEPVFAGHFPGNPIFPGVLTLALVRETVRRADGGAWVIASIGRQKLMRPLVPGDEVAVRCRVVERGDAALALDCKLTLADGTAVATARLRLAPAPGAGGGAA